MNRATIGGVLALGGLFLASVTWFNSQKFGALPILGVVIILVGLGLFLGSTGKGPLKGS